MYNINRTSWSLTALHFNLPEEKQRLVYSDGRIETVNHQVTHFYSVVKSTAETIKLIRRARV